ncbi:MAG: putative selenate ABC transporter substrate-binding protein [Planctomycetota bacterium]|nr:putative selenate ABC transporter substrate-binding protein [Planctomycetota bacterium]
MTQDLPRNQSVTWRQLGAATFLLLPLLAGCGKEDHQVLYFSAIPDANKADLKEKYDQIAAHLSKELGVTVEYKPSAKYSASVEAFKNGDIQLAWFGGVTGVQARDGVEGALAIAQGQVDPKYYSYFIAHKDSGVEPSDTFPMSLEGKSFMFGSPDSTSGRVMPEYHIRLNTDREPEQFFGHKNRYSGGHDLTAKAVESGSVDAGVLSYKKYDSMVAGGELDPEVCRIVWRTPDYPDYNWTAHPMIDEMFGEGFITKLQGALVAIKEKELLEALLRPEGLIPAKNGDFDMIADTLKDLGLGR